METTIGTKMVVVKIESKYGPGGNVRFADLAKKFWHNYWSNRIYLYTAYPCNIICPKFLFKKEF